MTEFMTSTFGSTKMLLLLVILAWYWKIIFFMLHNIICWLITLLPVFFMEVHFLDILYTSVEEMFEG